MAVMVVIRWPGVGPEQYDAVRELVNWEGDVPEGGRFHVAAVDADGVMRISDLWESAEAFQRFTASRLIPGVQQLGIPAEPQVEIFPAHRVFAPGYRPR